MAARTSKRAEASAIPTEEMPRCRSDRLDLSAPPMLSASEVVRGLSDRSSHMMALVEEIILAIMPQHSCVAMFELASTCVRDAGALASASMRKLNAWGPSLFFEK